MTDADHQYEFILDERAPPSPARIAHFLTVRHACIAIAEQNGVPFEYVWNRAKALHDYYGFHWHVRSAWPFVGEKLGFRATIPTSH